MAISSLPTWVPFAGVGAVIVVATIVAFTTGGMLDREFRVAFIGAGGELIMNDVPRVMEQISEGKIKQNSCLHPKGSLSSVALTGNGMYEQWKTSRAQLSTDEDNNIIYDFGACTLSQLMSGSDELLVEDNYNGAYYDDGRNPCFYDSSYLYYLQNALSSDSQVKWDFVVLSDKTKRMAFQDTREDAIDSFATNYVSLIKNSGAVPLIVDGHAFWSDNTNMTGLDDIATFTSLVYEGARQYQSSLAQQLPSSQKPRIAPVGLAYLAVYEEDFDMWEKLFYEDGIHASVYGTYLTACVLYCTMTGHMPRAAAANDVSTLFETARAVSGAANGYPDEGEAGFLFNIAKKVARRGYRPKTLELYDSTN